MTLPGAACVSQRPIFSEKEPDMRLRRFKPVLFLLCLLVLLPLCGCAKPVQEAAVLPELRIGASIYAPYFFRDADGGYSGIDAQIAQEACRRIGYTAVFKEIALDDRFSTLSAGNVDCLWSCLSMQGRETEYLWAGPYLYAQRVVAVRADSEIQTLDDLRDKRVSVQAGSTSESILLGKRNADIPELRQLTVFSTIGEVFTALRKGYVDAAAGIEGALLVYLNEYPGAYRCLNMSIQTEPLGVAFRQGSDAALVSAIQDALDDMREDGTIAGIVAAYGLDVQKNVYGGSTDANHTAAETE